MRQFQLEKDKILHLTRGGGCYYPSIRLLIHPFSIRLTYILAKMGIHPNYVSFFCIFISIFSIVSFWMEYYIIALFFYWVRTVLDYTDGALARYAGKESRSGAKLDLWIDYFFYCGTWILYALKLETPIFGAFTVIAAIAYFLTVDHYIEPKLKALERRDPLKKYFMDRGIVIGFAPFGIFELWSFMFFAVGISTKYFIFLPTIVFVDLCYRLFEVIRFHE